MPSSCRIGEKLLVWTLRSGGGSSESGRSGAGTGFGALERRQVATIRPGRLRRQAVDVLGMAMFFSVLKGRAQLAESIRLRPSVQAPWNLLAECSEFLAQSATKEATRGQPDATGVAKPSGLAGLHVLLHPKGVETSRIDFIPPRIQEIGGPRKTLHGSVKKVKKFRIARPEAGKMGPWTRPVKAC